MAVGKNNKVDKNNNPFYPPRKESLLKEIGTTLGVVVVCIVLVGVIVKNFNVYTIAQRTEAKASGQEDTYQQDDVSFEGDESQEYRYDETTDEYQQEIIINEPGNEVLEEPLYESTGTVIEEPINHPENDDYIIPDSNTRYLTFADLEGLTAEECRIARNEIFARHGRMFKDSALQAYFDSKPWYTGTIAPDNFTQDMLSELEIANTKTISDYESSRGY